MDERLVATLRELDARDAELGARLARLDAIASEVEAVRAGAERAGAFATAHPDRLAQFQAAVDAAAVEADERRAAVARAEHEPALAAAEEETRVAAERARTRARDRLAAATARLDRADAALAEQERDARAAPVEIASLARRAAAVSHEVEEPEPSPDAYALADWAARARATLFTATGHEETQRERVIREANELATSLLGEPTYGSTVAQVRARVEGALRLSSS